MINQGLEVYIGTDEQKLTFIYIKDLVKAYYLAIESGVFNKSYFLSEPKYYATKTFLFNDKKRIE